jgi:chromate reductase, NAD(P)H dehydrogenase (quinone)
MAERTLKPGSEPKLKVLVFAASLRAESLNRKLAALAARIAEQSGSTVDHASMRDCDVPSYDGDAENIQGIPKGAEELRRRLLESDAFIVSSPEYYASMPGIFKNLPEQTLLARSVVADAGEVLEGRNTRYKKHVARAA